MKPVTSKYQTLLDSLDRQGKLQPLDSVVTPEVTQRMNEEMEAVRRDYRRKDAESKQAASLVILNA